MKLPILFVSLFACLALSACNKVDFGMSVKEYIIKAGKGSHDALNQPATELPSRLNGIKHLEFKAMFDDSAKYSGAERTDWNLSPSDQLLLELSVNKLYGFSDCGANFALDAHESSVRVGWRWAPESNPLTPVKNSVQFFAYSYKDGKRFVPSIVPAIGEAEGTYIGSVLPHEWGNFSIDVTDTSYLVTLNGNTVTHPRQCSGEQRGFQLTPFFGGQFAAPHDIRILIKGLNNDYK